MTATMTPCSTAIVQYWLKRAYCRSCTHSIEIITNVFARKFYAQRMLSFKVKTWKFAKNKLLKLVDSIKEDFLFAGLNLNIIIQKNCQKKHISWTTLSKQGAL